MGQPPHDFTNPYGTPGASKRIAEILTDGLCEFCGVDARGWVTCADLPTAGGCLNHQRAVQRSAGAA